MATINVKRANDLFRTTLGRDPVFAACPCLITCTPAVSALSQAALQRLLGLVQEYDDWTPGNDQYAEHDFGAVKLEGEVYFWKIDYYAPDMVHGAEDPADLVNTRRVMTLMHAMEY